MRFLGFLIGCFFMSSAFAQESSGRVSDLNYFPNLGDFVFEAGYIYSTGDVKFNNTKVGDLDTSTFMIGFEYGALQNWSFGLDVSYETEKLEVQGVAGEFKSKGISDPNFKVSHRAYSQDNIDLDLNFNFSPYTGKKRYGSISNDGNAKRGGSNFTFGPELNIKINETLSVVAEFVIDHTGKTKDSDGDHVKSTTDYSLILSTQLRPTPQYFIRPTLGYNIYDDRKDSKGAKSEIDNSLFYGLTFGVDIDNTSALALIMGKTKNNLNTLEIDVFMISLGYLKSF